MKKLLLLLVLSPFLVSAQCGHTICLSDTYGDGWNGGTATVTVNGTPVLTNITLASGSGPVCFTFQAQTGDNIQVTYSSGSWAYENNYAITDGTGATMVSGYFPNSSGTWNGSANCPASGGSQCGHTICLSDTYGDGWNGGAATVTVNGTPVLTNITLASGSGPLCFTFQAQTGDNIQVTYSSGSWAYENNYAITDGTGATMVSGYFPNSSGTWNGSANCPSSGGSQCGHNLCLSDTYGDGWNGGAATVTVNGTPVLTNITLASGSGPLCFPFPAQTGDNIQVTYSSGSWAYENNYAITDGTGATLTSGYFPNSSGTWNGNGFCGGALPVELINFSGDCDYIYWSTASENNSDYFEIEMSIDGYSWEAIDYVAAAGNSINIIDYSVARRSEFAIQYYRLRQVDYDGEFEIFDPISVGCKDAKNKGEIVGIYNTAGQFIGVYYPTTPGIYLVRYSAGDVKRIFVH